MNFSSDNRRIEFEWEIAYAKLGVIEDAAVALAGGWALFLAAVFDNWWLALLIVPGYFAARYPYAKREASAEDAWHRIAKIGKYSRALQEGAEE